MQSSFTQFHLVIGGADRGGVLSAGHILAGAALHEYEHVQWFPNYAASTADGDAECSVVLTGRTEAASIPLQASAAIVAGRAARRRLERLVQPGGVLVVDSTTCAGGPDRDDLHVYAVPASQVAAELGAADAASLVLLGALVAVTKILPVDALRGELERHLRGCRQDELLPNSLEALARGVALASSAAV